MTQLLLRLIFMLWKTTFWLSFYSIKPVYNLYIKVQLSENKSLILQGLRSRTLTSKVGLQDAARTCTLGPDIRTHPVHKGRVQGNIEE